MTAQLSEIRLVKFLMTNWGIGAMIIVFFASNSVNQYFTLTLNHFETMSLEKLLTILFIDSIGITICMCIFAYLFKILTELEKDGIK